MNKNRNFESIFIELKMFNTKLKQESFKSNCIGKYKSKIGNYENTRAIRGQ